MSLGGKKVSPKHGHQMSSVSNEIPSSAHSMTRKKPAIKIKVNNPGSILQKINQNKGIFNKNAEKNQEASK